MGIADGCRQRCWPDRSGSDSTPAAGRHFPAPGDENQGAFKLILSTPGTPSISHVWVNLAAVAIGTLKVLAWVAGLGVMIFGALFAGMLKAGLRQGRRTW